MFFPNIRRFPLSRRDLLEKDPAAIRHSGKNIYSMEYVHGYSSFCEKLVHDRDFVYSLLRELGYKAIGDLGGGAFGYGFELEGGLVAKVSYDRFEKLQVARLVGQKSEYIADYVDIYEGRDFDIIIMEKLGRLGAAEIEKANRIIDLAADRRYAELAAYIGSRLFFQTMRMLYECRKKGVSLDTSGANLGLKRGHIAAFDVSSREEEGHEFKSAETAIASLERLGHMTRRYSPQEIWDDFEKRRAL